MNETHDPNGLTPQDEAQLDRATGDAPRKEGDAPHRAQHDDAQRAAAALQAGLTPEREMPADLRQRLLADGLALVQARNPLLQEERSGTERSRLWPVALAAAILIAIGVGIVGYALVTQRTSELEQQRELVAQLREQAAQNQTLLAGARENIERLDREVARLGDTNTELDRDLTDARRRERELATGNIELAQQLAGATNDIDRLEASLGDAELRIAQFEAPVDPAQLRRNRASLLALDDTFEAEWAPFVVEGLPDPEQQGAVTGDVVWNDTLQQGYIRFVGLRPNDPDVEQYQIWVIDERGLEQKVSGGVFNVDREGEIIVPIHPGIDVGRVGLFAITVEKPGGTWVPDLARRVTVAQRPAG